MLYIFNVNIKLLKLQGKRTLKIYNTLREAIVETIICNYINNKLSLAGA